MITDEQKQELKELREMLQAAKVEPREFWEELGFDAENMARLAGVMAIAAKMLDSESIAYALLGAMQVGAAIALQAKAHGRQRRIVI